MDNDQIQKTVTLSLEKFNKESGLANRFALLKVTRASAGVSFVHQDVMGHAVLSHLSVFCTIYIMNTWSVQIIL